jgi:hypothetical protein
MEYLPLPSSITNTLLSHPPRLPLPFAGGGGKKKVKMSSLVDISARFIAQHVAQIPNKREGFAALTALQLDEAVQKHMGRLNQIHYFHQYRTHYRDGKPELLEHYDDEGRKHGRCLYWNENGRVDSMLKYHHGLPHGSQKWYDLRGVLVKQLRYKAGKFKEEVIVERRVYSPYNYPFHHLHHHSQGQNQQQQQQRRPLSSGASASASSSPSTAPSFSPVISSASIKSTQAALLHTSSCGDSDKLGQHRPTFSKPLSLK